MHVLKFGGTSVGSVNSLKQVKRIVESRTEPVVVVVSALGGITDRLIATAEMAARGDENFHTSLQQIRNRHHEVAFGMLHAESLQGTLLFIDRHLDELYNILKGVYLIRELSPRTLAAIVSYGERISSRMVAEIITGAQHLDSREIIKASLKERYETYKLAKDCGIMTINEMRRNENMNEVQGLDIIDLGLGSVLFDTITGETYTPNTDSTKAAGISDSGGAIQTQGGEINAD